MEYQAYVLPKKRDRFFQHFLSSAAEDNYLNKYAALSGDINVTGSFFDIGMREIALPYDNILTSLNFYLVNFLRIKENGNYYYYNVTGIIKQTPKLILYAIELDEYHTFFNNRGSDYNFTGYLKFSNTRCIEDKDKLFLNPSKSMGSETKIEAEWTGGYVGIGCVKWSRGGFSIIVTDPEDMPKNAAGYISSLLKDGEIDIITMPESQNPITENEKFEILNAYIVPEILIEPYYKDITQYKHGVYKGYSFRETGKQTFTIPIQNYRTKIVEFGTFSSRINCGVNGENIVAKIELTANELSSDIDISLTIGNQKISLTDDFGYTLTISALTSYLASNKISIAMNALSAVGGLATGIATGNVVSIIGSAKAGIDVGNDIFKQSQRPSSTYGGGSAALTYGKLFRGFGMWIYTPENYNELYYTKLIIGGDCQNSQIYFYNMKTTDKTTQNGVYNFYEFTKIVSNFAQVNRIAPLLLGGIEIEFIE